jgi:basic membrane lipoprotein Med (substrate-binding protein (PBP1-ABC) superfamily)
MAAQTYDAKTHPPCQTILRKCGKRAFGWDSDMTTYGPKAHLFAINWGPYYVSAVGEALEGSNRRHQLMVGVKKKAPLTHGVDCRCT